jgi:AcrR family transcriptional regulator
MSNKKRTDLRPQRTQRWLQTALRDLMEEKPYQKIRVGEITKRAELSRPTFYLHYESKDDLLVSLFDEVFVEFRAELRKELAQNNVDMQLFGTLIFSYWGKNADIIRIFLEAGVENHFLKRIHTIFLEVVEEIREVDYIAQSPIIPYFIDFTTGGLFMVLKRWIQEDMIIPPEMFGFVFGQVVAQFRPIALAAAPNK